MISKPSVGLAEDLHAAVTATLDELWDELKPRASACKQKLGQGPKLG